MTRRIKLILWDFNGVTVDGDHTITSKRYGKIHHTPWKKVYAMFYTKYFNLFAMNRIAEREAWEGPIRELGWKQDWRNMRKWHLDRQRLNKNVVAYIGSIRRRGYRCVLISKNIDSWFRYVERRIHFRKHFDAVVTTQTLNLPKSSPRTVRYLCSRFKVAPREIIYIDDQRFNLAAPERMGVHTVLYKNLKQCRREVGRLLKA